MLEKEFTPYRSGEFGKLRFYNLKFALLGRRRLHPEFEPKEYVFSDGGGNVFTTDGRSMFVSKIILQKGVYRAIKVTSNKIILDYLGIRLSKSAKYPIPNINKVLNKLEDAVECYSFYTNNRVRTSIIFDIFKDFQIAVNPVYVIEFSRRTCGYFKVYLTKTAADMSLSVKERNEEPIFFVGSSGARIFAVMPINLERDRD